MCKRQQKVNLCNPEHYENRIKNVMIVLLGLLLFSGVGGEWL